MSKCDHCRIGKGKLMYVSGDGYELNSQWKTESEAKAVASYINKTSETSRFRIKKNGKKWEVWVQY